MMKIKSSKFKTPTSLPQILIAVGIVAALIYTSFVALPFFQGPSLTVEESTVTPTGTTLIQGSTARVSSLTVNNLPIPITEEGEFAVERVFPPGYTVVVLEARDRFDRTRTQQLTFISHSSNNHGSQESNREKNIEEDDIEKRSEDSSGSEPEN